MMILYATKESAQTANFVRWSGNDKMDLATGNFRALFLSLYIFKKAVIIAEIMENSQAKNLLDEWNRDRV